jgi:DNA-binding NtrC family response regulator
MAEERYQTVRIDVAAGKGVSLELEAVSLRVAAGPDKGLRLSFPHETIRIGSGSDADLRLTDPSVSRNHAVLRVSAQGLQLEDLGSTNGTFVGDARVTGAYLEPGQGFRVGATEVAVERRTETRQGTVRERDGLGSMVGRSGAILELYAVLEAVAPTPASVLIQGESGTGKELVARTIHELSARAGPLVVFDAGVADPEMVRSDLFGHVKGAFTGAAAARDGAVRRAHTGTLFLDEIGELPLDLQPRLLRLLESREVQPVGGDEASPVDVRVVAATHRDLEAMVDEGLFREDLYHRLAVVPVEVPPLRERVEDLPLLVAHLVEHLQVTCRFTDAALAEMAKRPWTGNIRELRNVVERMGALKAGQDVGPGDLPPPRRRRGAGGEASGPATMAEIEAAAIRSALDAHDGNQSAAARQLGISLSTLRRRLKEWGES